MKEKTPQAEDMVPRALLESAKARWNGLQPMNALQSP